MSIHLHFYKSDCYANFVALPFENTISFKIGIGYYAYTTNPICAGESAITHPLLFNQLGEEQLITVVLEQDNFLVARSNIPVAHIYE